MEHRHARSVPPDLVRRWIIPLQTISCPTFPRASSATREKNDAARRFNLVSLSTPFRVERQNTTPLGMNTIVTIKTARLALKHAPNVTGQDNEFRIIAGSLRRHH